MKVIYKYQLKLAGNTLVSMPLFATPLCCKEQGGKLYLWAVVEPDNISVEYFFRTVLTGEDLGISANGSYIDTVLFDNGNYVVHVFNLTGI